MELESQRTLFNVPAFVPGLREFFLVDDKCISILCVDPPEIIDLGTDPGLGGTKV